MIVFFPAKIFLFLGPSIAPTDLDTLREGPNKLLGGVSFFRKHIKQSPPFIWKFRVSIKLHCSLFCKHEVNMEIWAVLGGFEFQCGYQLDSVLTSTSLYLYWFRRQDSPVPDYSGGYFTKIPFIITPSPSRFYDFLSNIVQFIIFLYKLPKKKLFMVCEVQF